MLVREKNCVPKTVPSFESKYINKISIQTLYIENGCGGYIFT